MAAATALTRVEDARWLWVFPVTRTTRNFFTAQFPALLASYAVAVALIFFAAHIKGVVDLHLMNLPTCIPGIRAKRTRRCRGRSCPSTSARNESSERFRRAGLGVSLQQPQFDGLRYGVGSSACVEDLQDRGDVVVDRTLSDVKFSRDFL